MADVHDPLTRSFNMSRIKGKDTAPEILVRKYLHSSGFRYKLHEKSLPGKPDIVLPKFKTVIFINGCFWHGHIDCKYAAIPKTRTEWWKDKINKNISNSIKAENELSRRGWKVITIWTCQLKPAAYQHTIQNLLKLFKTS